MTCYLQVITEESVLYNFYQVIYITDLTLTLRLLKNIILRKYYSRQFLLSSKNKLQMWLSLDWNNSEGIWPSVWYDD